MKKILFVILLNFGNIVFAQQQKLFSKKEIIASMDANAKLLLENSKGFSVSIGIVKDGKFYTKHYGEIDKGKGKIANNKNLFEIASTTKVFTGTLAAKAVLEGKINLDDDIRKHLNEPFPNLEFKGNPIRIKDLVTHKTGILTPFPDTKEIRQKYPPEDFLFHKNILDRTYKKSDFFTALHTVKTDTFSSTIYKYGALGPELLAHILENVYKKSYETLLKEIIFNQAGMTSTKISLSKTDRLINGYNAKEVKMDNLSSNLWGASKMLKSTLNDMLKFIEFELNENNKTVSESHRLIDKNQQMGYFWNISIDNDGNYSYVKDGGSNGIQNILEIYPKYNMGVIVIINQSDRSTGSNIEEASKGLIDDLKPFGKKSIGRAIQSKCLENIDTGILFYKKIKIENSNYYNFSNENELNTLGYLLMAKGEIQSSIKLFYLLTNEFPSSGNAFDSLAEAYFANKEYELSKLNYQKSLTLNPSNRNAMEMLKKLEELSRK